MYESEVTPYPYQLSPQFPPQRREESPVRPTQRTTRKTCRLHRGTQRAHIVHCCPPHATEEKEVHVTVRGDVNEDKDNDGA